MLQYYKSYIKYTKNKAQFMDNSFNYYFFYWPLFKITCSFMILSKLQYYSIIIILELCGLRCNKFHIYSF